MIQYVILQSLIAYSKLYMAPIGYQTYGVGGALGLRTQKDAHVKVPV